MGGLDYGSQKRALFRKKYNAISDLILIRKIYTGM